MEIITHKIQNINIAEIVTSEVIINNLEEGTDLLGNLYYQEFDRIILYEKNITSDFFDLKTRLAGEILQKFSNYRVRLAIVGNFSNYSSKSLNEFILESNKGKHINFVTSTEEAIRVLSEN